MRKKLSEIFDSNVSIFIMALIFAVSCFIAAHFGLNVGSNQQEMSVIEKNHFHQIENSPLKELIIIERVRSDISWKPQKLVRFHQES